jgi:hypothetical protein
MVLGTVTCTHLYPSVPDGRLQSPATSSCQAAPPLLDELVDEEELEEELPLLPPVDDDDEDDDDEDDDDDDDDDEELEDELPADPPAHATPASTTPNNPQDPARMNTTSVL